MQSTIETLREWSKRIRKVCSDPAFNVTSDYAAPDEKEFGKRIHEAYHSIEMNFPLYAELIGEKWEESFIGNHYDCRTGGLVSWQKSLLELSQTIEVSIQAIEQQQTVDKERQELQAAFEMRNNTDKSFTEIARDFGIDSKGAKAFEMRIRRFADDTNQTLKGSKRKNIQNK